MKRVSHSGRNKKSEKCWYFLEHQVPPSPWEGQDSKACGHNHIGGNW